ncbi:hypothetical protein ScPMuIL_008280 [Solemya velum]
MAHKSIIKILKSFNLRAVKNLAFTFDPYHENVRSIRELLFQMHARKIVNTNPNVETKVNIKADRCDPTINVKFVDGHEMIFKTKYLTTLDILERLNAACIEKDPKKRRNKNACYQIIKIIWQKIAFTLFISMYNNFICHVI